MTPELRWAAMRDILMFHNCEGQSHKTVSTDHNYWRERRVEADSNRSSSAYQPNALPLGQTGSQNSDYIRRFFHNRPHCLRQHNCKTQIVWIKTELIFHLERTRGMFTCVLRRLRLPQSHSYRNLSEVSVGGQTRENKDWDTVASVTSFGKVWRKVLWELKARLGVW